MWGVSRSQTATLGSKEKYPGKNALVVLAKVFNRSRFMKASSLAPRGISSSPNRRR